MSPARFSPLSLTLSAHTLAGEIKRISYVSRGKCTGERGPNAQHQNWRFRLRWGHSTPHVSLRQANQNSCSNRATIKPNLT